MKFMRTLMAALMVGALLGGPAVAPTVAASKSKNTSVLSKMTTGTKKFFNNIFNVKKLVGKKTAK